MLGRFGHQFVILGVLVVNFLNPLFVEKHLTDFFVYMIYLYIKINYE
jgi:hypothetical protein